MSAVNDGKPSPRKLIPGEVHEVSGTPASSDVAQEEQQTSDVNTQPHHHHRNVVQPQQKRQRAIVNNHNRAAVFRKWLIETFPTGSLKLILDVAGGKGEVSVPLALAGYECVVVDPRECDWSKNRIVKNLQFHMAAKDTKTYLALAERIGRERLERDGLPMPGRLLEYFDATTWDTNGSVVAEDTVDKATTSSASPPTTAPAFTMDYVKAHCTILVGMHSDEATEPIVDFALKHKRPFAVVPCCVFPKDNPHRRHPATGGKVESYQDFVAYLKAKTSLCGSPIIEHSLPFEGRNTVLYYIPNKSISNAVDEQLDMEIEDEAKESAAPAVATFHTVNSPIFQLEEDKRWVVRFQKGTHKKPVKIIIPDPKPMHAIVVQQCEHVLIVVHGKLDSVAVIKCRKVQLHIVCGVATVDVTESVDIDIEVHES